MSLNVVTYGCNVGAVSNTYRPIFKIPTYGGGITILSVDITGSAAGTSLVSLCDLGTAGTAPTSGTIVAPVSKVFVANVPHSLTVASAYVEPGHWVGVVEGGTGALPAACIVSIAYTLGE